MELDVADFAVFDWAEDITENMRWELMKTIDRFPCERILIVHNSLNRRAVEELLASPSCFRLVRLHASSCRADPTTSISGPSIVSLLRASAPRCTE